MFTHNAGNIFIEGKLTRTNPTFLDKVGMFEVMQKDNVELIHLQYFTFIMKQNNINIILNYVNCSINDSRGTFISLKNI